MAQPGTSLWLFHGREAFCNVLVLANIALSNGRFDEAVDHYTEVLYRLSPAHVCALLNRSVAYMDGGYYELAVMDAYRACIAASGLRKNNLVADSRLSKVAKYIRAERQHIAANDIWTMPGQRNVAPGWARSPLASLVLNASPDFAVPIGPEVPPFGRSKITLVRALEIRAIYRLCGALFMVGDGARNDALGLIDDAKARMRMNPLETGWFDKLGNEIMNQLVSEVDFSDPRDLKPLGHDTQDKRNERMMQLKESMKAATTSLRYGDYPWNPYEPKLGEPHWQKRIQAWVERCSANCSTLVFQPEETEDSQIEASKPYVELRANRDINSGDLVLSQQTVSNVTTSIPEQIEERSRAGIFDRYYCNSCASLLIVPHKCVKKFLKPVEQGDSRVTLTSSSLTHSSENSHNRTQNNHSTGTSSTTQFEQRSSNHDAPSVPARSSPRQDFMFCSPNHLVPTCSADCREMGEAFDKGICHTNLEQKIRHTRLNDPNPKSITACKTQCPRDLIFLRHITMAIDFGQHPLNLHDIMFSSSGPNLRGPETSVVEPWSFVSHVVRPVLDLQQLFANTDTDQFLKLSQIDGWVIHTLLIKINRAMRISNGPRYAKGFQTDGMLDTAFGPRDERWEGLTETPNEQEDTSICIASIDTLFSMIRIADPALGETPNVAVIQREGVHVYAVGTDAEPAIKAGEPLLRAPDGAQGPALDQRLYAEYLRSPVDESDELDDGVHSGDTSEFLDESCATEEGFEADEEEDEEVYEEVYEEADEGFGLFDADGTFGRFGRFDKGSGDLCLGGVER